MATPRTRAARRPHPRPRPYPLRRTTPGKTRPPSTARRPCPSAETVRRTECLATAHPPFRPADRERLPDRPRRPTPRRPSGALSAGTLRHTAAFSLGTPHQSCCPTGRQRRSEGRPMGLHPDTGADGERSRSVAHRTTNERGKQGWRMMSRETLGGRGRPPLDERQECCDGAGTSWSGSSGYRGVECPHQCALV